MSPISFYMLAIKALFLLLLLEMGWDIKGAILQEVTIHDYESLLQAKNLILPPPTQPPPTT